MGRATHRLVQPLPCPPRTGVNPGGSPCQDYLWLMPHLLAAPIKWKTVHHHLPYLPHLRRSHRRGTAEKGNPASINRTHVVPLSHINLLGFQAPETGRQLWTSLRCGHSMRSRVRKIRRVLGLPLRTVRFSPILYSQWGFRPDWISRGSW